MRSILCLKDLREIHRKWTAEHVHFISVHYYFRMYTSLIVRGIFSALFFIKMIFCTRFRNDGNGRWIKKKTTCCLFDERNVAPRMELVSLQMRLYVSNGDEPKWMTSLLNNATDAFQILFILLIFISYFLTFYTAYRIVGFWFQHFRTNSDLILSKRFFFSSPSIAFTSPFFSFLCDCVADLLIFSAWRINVHSKFVYYLY